MDLAELREKREEILRIAAKHGARNVRVFGSVARGDYNERSDIDIVIALDGSNLKGFAYFGTIEYLHEELEQLLGRPVDVVDESGLRDDIRSIVLSEAVAL
jgi:uncharacterized protein